jgi:uncharacterized protein YegJ (DUF2314 family)
MNVKRQYKKILSESGYKSLSTMQAVLPSYIEPLELTQLSHMLKEKSYFENITTTIHYNRLLIEFRYKKIDYKAMAVYGTVDNSYPFLSLHKLSYVEKLQFKNGNVGLYVQMQYSKSPCDSFHLQLKLLSTLVPNQTVVMDYTSHTILSGRWVKLAAASSVAPSLTYYCSVHINSQNDQVWLHTHGLSRFGKLELELFNIPADNKDNAYKILNALYCMAIEKDILKTPMEVIFIGTEIALTWQKSTAVIKKLSGLGTKRIDRLGHDWPFAAVFAYKDEDAYKKGLISDVRIFDEYLENNSIMYYSLDETYRKSVIARERVDYVLKYGLKDKNETIIKAGFVQDGQTDDTKEHLWFSLLSVEKSKLKCKLINAPYHVSSLKKGDVLIIENNIISDWMINVFDPEMTIMPDSVYLFEDI